MVIYVLNQKYETIGVLDSYESLIWTDRYNESGDFEIYTKVSSDVLNLLQVNNYLIISLSERVMIVEKIKITYDSEAGYNLIVSGRSLESILARRIVWNQTTISGNLQNGIKKLIDEAIISPKLAERKIENFIFEVSDDPFITGLTIDETQFTGDSLYDIIVTLCQMKKIGFKILLDNKNNLVFSLFNGIDRSYNQAKNPYVVLSRNYETLTSSNYTEDYTDYKNVTLIAGAGEGISRSNTTVGTESGLNRRELYTDARDISRTDDAGTTIAAATYTKLLKERGTSKLEESSVTQSFEIESNPEPMYTYGTDFYCGDLVQLVDDFGHEAEVRITEWIISHDSNGLTMYPTLSIFDSYKEGSA
nr:MAG TPA: hypothetical protein [Caudoviricetes sp.]